MNQATEIQETLTKYFQKNSITLGYYKPNGVPTVYHHSGEDNEYSDATSFHEQIHKRLTVRTTFGQFIMLLDEISEQENDELKLICRHLISKLIRSSYIVQEGSATLLHIFYITFRNRKHDIAIVNDIVKNQLEKLPLQYRVCFNVVSPIFLQLLKYENKYKTYYQIAMLFELIFASTLNSNVFDFVLNEEIENINELSDRIHNNQTINPDARLFRLTSFINENPQKFLFLIDLIYVNIQNQKENSKSNKYEFSEYINWLPIIDIIDNWIADNKLYPINKLVTKSDLEKLNVLRSSVVSKLVLNTNIEIENIKTISKIDVNGNEEKIEIKHQGEYTKVPLFTDVNMALSKSREFFKLETENEYSVFITISVFPGLNKGGIRNNGIPRFETFEDMNKNKLNLMMTPHGISFEQKNSINISSSIMLEIEKINDLEIFSKSMPIERISFYTNIYAWFFFLENDVDLNLLGKNIFILCPVMSLEYLVIAIKAGKTKATIFEKLIPNKKCIILKRDRQNFIFIYTERMEVLLNAVLDKSDVEVQTKSHLDIDVFFESSILKWQVLYSPNRVGVNN